MKKEKEKKGTLTYYGTPSISEKAKAKADREGYPFGEVVDELLKLYIKTKKGSLLAKPVRKTVLQFGREQYELK